MQAAGLDGIEIEAYGHLLDGFWSPATNRRSDAYGGSLDNRLRFTFEVLDAIRAAVGQDFIVGIRMVADEDWERGLSRADGIEIAQAPGCERPGRLPERHPRPHRDRRRAFPGHPDPGHARRPAPRLRRRGPECHKIPGVPRRPDQ